MAASRAREWICSNMIWDIHCCTFQIGVRSLHSDRFYNDFFQRMREIGLSPNEEQLNSIRDWVLRQIEVYHPKYKDGQLHRIYIGWTGAWQFDYIHKDLPPCNEGQRPPILQLIPIGFREEISPKGRVNIYQDQPKEGDSPNDR